MSNLALYSHRHFDLNVFTIIDEISYTFTAMNFSSSVYEGRLPVATAKELSSGFAAIVIEEYDREPYFEWLDLVDAQDNCEEPDPSIADQKPLPVAVHELDLPEVTSDERAGYLFAVAVMLGGQPHPLGITDLEDLQFRLDLGLIEPLPVSL